MDDKKRRDPIAAIIAALPAALLAAYVFAYFYLGKWGTATVPGQAPVKVRIYRGRWQADLFTPAVKVESWIRGYPIHTAHI